MPKSKAKIPAGVPRELTSVVEQKGEVTALPTHGFTSVGTQQGRVPLDPDSNEQGAIDGRPPRFKKI